MYFSDNADVFPTSSPHSGLGAQPEDWVWWQVEPAPAGNFMLGERENQFSLTRVALRTGGAGFRFVSWVVPPSDPHRAVMPATVRLTDTHLVTAVRRRLLDLEQNWVDAYASEDRGKTWSFLSKVGDTGDQNGNPPALLHLKDGRLCCFYGNRVGRQLLVRCSRDQGKTWDAELVLRDDYASPENDADLGYPRAVQRSDGQVLVFYYWASRERPQQHIAATLWTP